MKDDKIRYISYACANPNCTAEDVNKYFPEEQNWLATTCHKCHAGTGKTVDQMIRSGVGMFPTHPVTYEPASA